MSDTTQIRPGYHNLLRPEILELIPQNVTSILDLGCGTGELGKAIKQRQDCIVDGIELNKAACEEAKKYLDTVWEDNLNRFDPSYLATKYDCIVFADILEHILSPWQVLKKFTQVLSDDGIIVISIPNIAHPWIISQLQKGLFRYEMAGILDITHLRFFTKTTVGQMIYSAGLKLKSITPHPAENNPIQYLITATKPKNSDEKKEVTILMLTLNCWRYTKQCLDSIKRNTNIPYKCLVIDNGSTDETLGHLRADNSIYHIENSCNLGFARGFNIGMMMVETPYFMICNNDLVVTKKWLTRMVLHIDEDDNVLGIGPRSNYVSGPQMVKGANYNTEETLEEFAESWRISQKIQTTPTIRLPFFCVLFKSRVIQMIGLLDERFEIGNFEDDDYCLQIAMIERRLLIDNTVYIHHHGSKTFKDNNIDYKKAMKDNQARFEKKWGIKL